MFNAWVGNKFLDEFFKLITYLGDGLFLIAIAVVLMFVNFKNSLFLLISYALSGGFTQLLKNLVFDKVDRPFLFYSFYNFKFKLVDGVVMFINRSFPSGHSTSAFCLFFCLAFMVKNHYLKLLFFLLGLITAFSRVYLSQHFFRDICAGAIIGVCFSSLVALIFYHTKLNEKMNKLERPVYKLFK